MMLWLRKLENRDQIRSQLSMFTSNDLSEKLKKVGVPLEINIKFSNYFKLKYDHEQYPDAVEIWQYKKPNGATERHIFIWEIKPALYDYDAILRQVNKYAEIVPKYIKNDDTMKYVRAKCPRLRELIKIVVFNACKHKIEDVKELFREDNVFLYQLLPMEVTIKK